MRWPWSSNPGDTDPDKKYTDLTKPLPSRPQENPRPAHKSTDFTSIVSQNRFSPDWDNLKEPSNLVPVLLLTGSILGLYAFWKSYIRRIPGADNINPGFFRRRSLFGTVTRVGDGDNFHLYHQPLGRLAGWGWLRHIPAGAGELKDKTLHIRLAGVDAPELAHFGRPAQPHASEALSFLQKFILHRRARVYIYKRDQYNRVVATVYVRRFPGLWRTDVGLVMLKRGLAAVYDAKTGAEFGKLEEKYRKAEAKARRKGLGLWQDKDVETPGEYKRRLGVGKPVEEKQGVLGWLGVKK